MAGYITARELMDASVDAGTLGTYANGEAGTPNVNRAGNDVGTLADINADAAAAILQVDARFPGKGYPSVAVMNSDLSPSEGTLATVTNDPTPSNDGLYRKVGVPGSGSWERATYDPASIGRRNGYIVHGALTYQYYDRSNSTWVISHGQLTVMLGAGRGQITVPAAENVVIALNRMYYVDLAGVASGGTVAAQLTPGNADNYPVYGRGAFVDDLKLPLFTFRGGNPGGLLFGRTLDQSNNWLAITPAWFKSSAATVVSYDAETRTLAWDGQIVCPMTRANTGRAMVLPAFSIVVPEGNYQVVWLDLRKLPIDPATPLDPAVMIKVGAYSEGFSSDTAYRALRYQLPLFEVGSGVAAPMAGFFVNQIQGVIYPADTSSLQTQVAALSSQVEDLAEDIANSGVGSSRESQDPVYLRDGVIYRHDAEGEQVVSDQTPNVYSAPPYWRGRAVISVLDRATLTPSTAVAIKVDGELIHPSASNLITILAGYGQSNGRGTRGNFGAAVPPMDPKYASTMQMFDGGPDMDVRLGVKSADFGAPISPSVLTGFQALRSVDTADNVGTTMMEGVAASLHEMLDEQLSLLPSYLYFTAARGGTNLAGLVKGTVPYENFMIAVQRAKDLAAVVGKHVWLPAVLWVHGESDTANTSYATQLIAFWNDLNTDVKAITGQLADVQMMMAQPSSFQSFQAPLQMLLAAEMNSNFHVVCPGYPLPFYSGDYLHYDRVGHFKLGEYCWKVVNNVLYGDRSWRPLQPESVSFNGTNQVQITFHVPVGALVLDPDATDKDGNWGFQLFNGTTQVAISDKALAGNVVTLTAASNLTTGNASVRYALSGQTDPRTAAAIPRGRLRDSDSTPSLVDGVPLPNWCVHFEESF